jgi:arylsulfatase A-like enzyme/Flp pilus assembly protein TadD
MAGVTRGRLVFAGIGLAVVAAGVAVVLLTLRSGRQDAPTVSHLAARSIVLITVDTLRADRVGAYGWKAARTPAMDAIAARGVRFQRAFAPAPITLTSHASLLTGLYPPGHGSRHNGMRVRGDVATLATVLHDQGWATGAFVGAFPLDRRFGLDRGFERYGDRMPRASDGRLLNERSGRVVVDEALDWLNGVGDRSFFLWVHLFEPHAPYEPDAARGPNGGTLPPDLRYDDEIARADVEIERLLAGLRPRLSSALVVVAGDHGEAFGEHGEITHSIFLYDATLRVPLIMAGPGINPAPSAPETNVSLVDVLPTVIDALGLSRPDVDGVSLLPLVRGGTLSARDLYAETFAPLLDFGWSSLRSVRSGPWKYIAAPSPELYDLSSDPGEDHSVGQGQGSRVGDMATRVAKYSGPELPAAPAGEQPDSEARSRLGALGYVSASASGARTADRPDPKDRRELAARIAQVAAGELQGAALRTTLETIIAEDPRNGQAQMRLGYAVIDSGDLRRAESHFRAALAAAMPTADVHLGLALCLASTGRRDEAVRVLMEARRIEPGNAVVEANLGSLALDGGDNARAIESLGSAIQLDPDLHQARFNLARALARMGRRDEAQKEAETLLARLPAQAPQRAEVQRMIDALR